ncbi:MAG: hypothetical protein M1823_004073 [Watsoniomyces obsoletus]|nr:MAG: hypothetical protein M1823_004073 [Watsoniomyces obsoletus]
MNVNAALAHVPVWEPGHPPQELLDYLDTLHEAQWEGMDHLETASDDSADHRNALTRGWLIRSGRRAYLRITRRRERGEFENWYDTQFVTADGTRAPRDSIWFTRQFLDIGVRRFVVEAAHRHRLWYYQARRQYFEDLAVWRQEQRAWEERVLMDVWGQVDFPVTFPPHTEDYTYTFPPTPTLSHTPTPSPDPTLSPEPGQTSSSSSSSGPGSSSDETVDIQPIGILHWLDGIEISEPGEEWDPIELGSSSP